MFNKISVIVPVYNVSKYLNRCLYSIVKQTYKNLEIILVDDGSTDGSSKICDDLALDDNRVKVIHKNNGGVSSARNAGLNLASGEYVSFVDSDDTLEFDMYEELYHLISTTKADVAICGNSHMDEKGIKFYEYIPEKCALVGESIMQEFFLDRKFDPNSPWNKLYKRTIIEKNAISFNENIKIGEDFLFNYNFFKKASKIVTLDKALYNYFISRENSAMKNVSKERINRWHTAESMLENEKDNGAVYSCCLTRMGKEMFSCLRELFKSQDKEFINLNYSGFVNCIKKYKKDLLKSNGISRTSKVIFLFILLAPNLFKNIYITYLQIKSK